MARAVSTTAVRSATLAAVVFGCGGPAPVVAPAAAIAVKKVEPAPVAAPSETPTPGEGAVGVVRMAREAPERFFHAVPTFNRIASAVDAQLPREVLDQLDETSPYEIVVTAERRMLRAPEVGFVSSTALRSSADELLDAARDNGVQVLPSPDGGTMLMGRGDVRCLLVDDLQPARLVCGSSAEEVAQHAPYAARVLPRLDLPPGLVAARAWAEPLRDTFSGSLLAARNLGASLLSGEAESKLPTLAPLLAPLAKPGVAELLALSEDVIDLTVAIDTQMSDQAGPSGITLPIDHIDVTVRLSPTPKSAFANQLKEASAHAKPLPRWLGRLPTDTTSVFVSTTSGASALDGLRRSVAEHWVEPLAQADPAVRKIITDSALPGAPFAYANGLADQKWEDCYGCTKPDASGKNTIAEGIRRQVTARFGWRLLVIDEPFEAYLKNAEYLFEAYNQGPLRDLVYDAFKGLCKGLPTKLTRIDKPDTRLPAEAVRFEMRVPSQTLEQCANKNYGPTAKTDEIVGLVLVVPDGERTWLGLSLEPEKLITIMANALDASRDAEPRVGLWQGGTPVSVGYFTPVGVAVTRSNLESFRMGRYTATHLVRETQRYMAKGGLEPWPFRLDVTSREESLDVRVRADASRELLIGR